MKTILVTGCAGFISSSLVPFLEEYQEEYQDYCIAYKIYDILHRLCSPSTKKSITFVEESAGYD